MAVQTTTVTGSAVCRVRSRRGGVGESHLADRASKNNIFSSLCIFSDKKNDIKLFVIRVHRIVFSTLRDFGSGVDIDKLLCTINTTLDTEILGSKKYTALETQF